MAKQINETGYRVVVDPKPEMSIFYHIYGDNWKTKRLEDLKSKAEEIAAQIKRHVDNVGFVQVEAETEAVCSHCGRDWTEDGAAYNGGCCDEDEKANPELIAATSTVEG